MDERKRRLRPTVAQMRELEERIGTLEDEKAMLVTRYESQQRHYKYMADELERVREECKELEKKVEDLKSDNYFLLNRGFWARVFNRQ